MLASCSLMHVLDECGLEGALIWLQEQRQGREAAEAEVASLRQQLEETAQAQSTALAALNLEMKSIEARSTTAVQVCLHQQNLEHHCAIR